MIQKKSLRGFFWGFTPAKKLEKPLGLDNTMLESILAGIGDAVCVFDKDFNIIFQSPLHTKWFDKLEEFICLKRIEGTKPNRTIKTIINKIGPPLHLEVSTFPVKDNEDQFFAGINIVRNVSRTFEPEAKLSNGQKKIPSVEFKTTETITNPHKVKILASLEKNRWNKTLTAKDLNISRATLWRKMKAYSLQNN